MDSEAVFKRYDIRGKHPEEIDGKFAERLGKAFGTFVSREGAERIVLTRDTKQSSISLKQKFIEGVKSTGTEVLDAGIGPTDYTAFTGVENNCFSAQITSSHLPLEFNGFKFMYPEGNGLMNDDLDRVKGIFRQEDFVSGDGEVEDIEDSSIKKYRRAIARYVRNFSDSIEKKVVVETMGGATSVVLPGVLREFGAEVVDISEGSGGPRIDPPNPKPENLEHLEERMEETNADIGIATDMDGDRVAIYYGGEWLDGNQVFSLLAKMVDPDHLVASIDTSRQVEEVAEQIGADTSYTRVGDPFVISETLENDAELSGEPNGHYCFRGFVPYNSGSLAALMVAAADLSALEELPERPTMRESVEVERKEEKMEKIEQKVREEYSIVSTVDGVKFRVGDSSVLIRPSGSSPKLRVTVDGTDRDSTADALEVAVQLIRNT